MAESNKCRLNLGKIRQLDCKIIVCFWTVKCTFKNETLEGVWLQSSIEFELNFQKWKWRSSTMTYINASAMQSIMSRNGLTHNYFEFYKWKWLIHVRFRTKFIHINMKGVGQDRNTYTTWTWTREHNPKNKRS